MRILVLSHNIIERGNYFRALKLACHLAAKGHNVTFVPTSHRWYKPNKYKLGNVKVIESPGYSIVIGNDEGWSPVGTLYRLWLVLRNKYHVVYGFSHKPVDFIPAWFSRIFKGSFYITDWCDWWGRGGLLEMIRHFRDMDPTLSRFKKFILNLYNRTEEFLEEYVPRRAHMVTVICRALFERALALGVSEEKIIRIVSGADTESIKPMDKEKARGQIHLYSLLPEELDPKKAVILGYTANYHLDEYLLLEAFSKVCRERDSVKMLVLGADFRIQRKMKEWGIRVFDVRKGGRIKKEHNIIHFGRRPFREVNAFLAASDILLLPMSDIVYNRGRWSHKIGDYLAAGRPVVVNDVGDIPELVRAEHVGCVARPDADDFADKIIRLIDERDKWETYGRNAENLARTKLDWDVLGDVLYAKLAELYKKVKP